MRLGENGRAGEIRTHDLLHPMQARYQATLQPEGSSEGSRSPMPRPYASPFRQLPPEVTPGKSVPGTGLEVALKSERFCLIGKGYVNDQFPRFMGRRVRRSARIVVKQPLLEVPRHTHVPLVLMIDAL
jgi:hypothetical protein